MSGYKMAMVSKARYCTAEARTRWAATSFRNIADDKASTMEADRAMRKKSTDSANKLALRAKRAALREQYNTVGPKAM